MLDEKFIDSMIIINKEVNYKCVHDYVCVTRTKREGYKYIHSAELVMNVREDEFRQILKSGSYHSVIIHSLLALRPELIISIPKGIKVVWLAWGYDIYQPVYGHRAMITINNLYHKETLKNKRHYLLITLKDLLYRVKAVRSNKLVETAISRFDFFSGVIPEEYGLIKEERRNSFFRAKPLVFQYGEIDSIIRKSNINQSFTLGSDILVGNSADETNNHLDAFNLLSHYVIGSKQVMSILSYAGTKDYVEVVEKRGRDIWGDSFIALKQFMKYQEYEKRMNGVGYGLFYLERQQAMGNIITLLWKGAMVFLSETSPLYVFFKKRGFGVFSIQNDLWRIEKDERLTREEQVINRELLLEHFSIENIKDKVNAFYRALHV